MKSTRILPVLLVLGLAAPFLARGQTARLNNSTASSYGPRVAIAQPADSVPAIRFTPVDSSLAGATVEEIQIMALVLEKSFERVLDRQSLTYRMGIPMLFEGSSRLVRGAYLEGFGALFEMSVSFPLIAPAEGAEQSPAAPPDTDWEKARRELLGQKVTSTRVIFSTQPFDGEKVTALRRQLIQALREAANMKSLKPEEFVAVVVSGPQAAAQVSSADSSPAEADSYAGLSNRRDSRSSSRSGSSSSTSSSSTGGYAGGSSSFSSRYGSSSGNSFYYSVQSDGAPATTYLTLRARKSDLDDFAQGLLSAEDFQKKIDLHTYEASGTAATDSGAKPKNP